LYIAAKLIVIVTANQKISKDIAYQDLKNLNCCRRKCIDSLKLKISKFDLLQTLGKNVPVCCDARDALFKS